MYEGTYDGDLVLQPEEVDGVLMMSLEDILEREQEFTPDGINALKVYIERTAQRS